MAKRVVSLLLALVLAVSLAACGETAEEYPLTVNGTPVNGEIFRYFYDLACADETLTSREARMQSATERCIRYVAVNSTFRAWGLSLTGAEKAACAERANALWRAMSAHYKRIGVSKETFLKLRLSDTYIENMRFALFDRGGTKPLSDALLKSYFEQSYVAVKMVRCNLYDTDIYGSRVEYSQEMLQAILERYNYAVDQINMGVALDFMYASLINEGNDEVRQALKTEIVPRDTADYPAGFFDFVKNMANGKAAIMDFDDYLFLVYRVDILSDNNYFEENRQDCLLVVSEPYLQSEINNMCNAYSSVRNSGAVEDCCRTVEKVRGAL
ncbi:MAG: hypothetical protein IK104_08125 [Clostridia bacterium]|nr:hypothetical protein [Clostridia bacterium]